MLNCRSISPQTWESARQALVFYFTRRHGLSGAEDLAHETLAAILRREDYQFEKEDDFLKVCYGFASYILISSQREAAKFSFDPGTTRYEVSGGGQRRHRRPMAAPVADAHGLKDAELSIYLDEVLRLGRDQLREPDWELIQQSIALDGETSADTNPDEANRVRVKLYRARKKLAQLAGWRRGATD